MPMKSNSSQISSIRRVAHLLLAIPTVLGLTLLFLFVTNSARSTVSDSHVSTLAVDAWTAAAQKIPAEMPAAWSDVEDPEPESVDDLDQETRERWGRTNAFIFSCAVLVLLGGFGIALTTAGLTKKEPTWFPLLRFGALLPATLSVWLLWGFNVAFPGETMGPIPSLYFGFPDSDPVAYGMGGMTGWTDCFYITSYAVFASTLLLTFAAAKVRATSLVLIAVPFLAISFPLVISWKWGAGWIEMLGNNIDFAGSALVHWHVGAAALAAGLILTIFRKQSIQPSEEETFQPSLGLIGVGGTLYFLGILGMNAGSTLDSDPVPVAAVLQATIAAAIVSSILSVIWWIGFRNRSPVEMFFLGLISGAVVVSGAADGLDWTRSLALGAVSGMVVPGLVVAMDRMRWVDPMAVGAVHGVGGLIGTLGAAFGDYGDDFLVTLPGQLVLVAVIPIGAVLTTIVVLILFGAIGFLFRDRAVAPPATAETDIPGQPPPLPPRN